MKLYTPEISWHQKEPIFSVDFCPNTFKLASSGADFTIKIWLVKEQNEDDRSISIEFLANLDRHVKPVNVVRFSPNGLLLASAGDDGAIILWKLNVNEKPSSSFGKEEDEDKESWNVYKMLRGHVEDIYDLAWSPDSSQLITGSVDNSAIIWDANKGQSLKVLSDHKHYIQGVCWDPRGSYLVTHSSDRTCRVYTATNPRCVHNISKNNMSYMIDGQLVKCKYTRMFMDETMQSFFRRCSYSTDGSFLFLPAGLCDGNDKPRMTTYIFSRECYSKPLRHLPGPKKATLAVKCSPVVYELIVDKENINPSNENDEFLGLPYRMVFAVASLDSVTFYDTQHQYPIGFCANMHYASLTDLAWSSDGKLLVVSSTDGYCSFIKFNEGELGIPIKYNPIEYQINKAEIKNSAKKKKEKQADGIKPEKKNPELTEKKDLKEKVKIDRNQTTIDKLFVTPIKKRKRLSNSEEKSKMNSATVIGQSPISVDISSTAVFEKCLSESNHFGSAQFETSLLVNKIANSEVSSPSRTSKLPVTLNLPCCEKISGDLIKKTVNSNELNQNESNCTKIISLPANQNTNKPPKRVNVTTLQTFTSTELPEPEQSPKQRQSNLPISNAFSPKHPKRVKVTTICTYNVPEHIADSTVKNDKSESLKINGCYPTTGPSEHSVSRKSSNDIDLKVASGLVTDLNVKQSSNIKSNSASNELAEKQNFEKTLANDTTALKENSVIVLD
ncbi:chromatin assembly factor 1 subunit B isoform X2 [Hydra vulgaris]|uniref:Chromatin assembly factor 1 subunit B isoform X2 n=1 Tax=Hydra vulgaris TaxID=6087 RepID=A0ABM4BKV0_HYDVU